MFQPGELVVYGTTGVCRVEEITCPNLTGKDPDKEYYRLDPLHQDGVIYAPVENGKVVIRPVISAEDAEALIDEIPNLRGEICQAPTVQALAQRYQAAVQSTDHRDLVRLLMSIQAKRRMAESKNRRLGSVDERYMKQTERLLHGELSAALGIPFEEVAAYITDRVQTARAAAVNE